MKKAYEIEIPELDKIPAPDWFRIKRYTTKQITEVKNLLDHNVWVTAARKQIYVKEMTTQHIINCIRCWNGEGNLRIPKDYLGGKDKWIKIFKEELTNRQ